MSRFHHYDPEQAYLLPPSVKDLLGERHLAFHVHKLIEAMEVQGFEQAYAAEGRLAYPPRMMLKVWLYAFCVRVTSTRKLEQRIREDIGFRYLAGGLTPDHKTLSEFLRRHRFALNTLFTHVLEQARGAGLVRLGHVAIDSTRVQASASRWRVRGEEDQRRHRLALRKQVREFQRKASEQDPDHGEGGLVMSGEEQAALEKTVEQMPRALPTLNKSAAQESTTDPDARFLRAPKGWVLGYTADVAVSDDHFIVAARVTQNANDNASLLPMLELVQQQCGSLPEKLTADCGFFSGQALAQLSALGVDAYVPDSNVVREFNTGVPAAGLGRSPIRNPHHQRMRAKLRSPDGRRIYGRRQAVVEPVFGVLKEQRGINKFRRRGLANVAIEWLLAVTAYNTTRLARY
jgi:transposase